MRRSFPKVDNFELAERHWRGNLILNNELTPESAARALAGGHASAVSFGRPFIGNPDLVERLRRGVPLSDYNPVLTYSSGPEGYIDYPVPT